LQELNNLARRHARREHRGDAADLDHAATDAVFPA
jgi:hypothetical protein